jgi:hypothetical protein
MPELNANIPPIECYVRGNFLRNQKDSHDKYFPLCSIWRCLNQEQKPTLSYNDGRWRVMVAYAYQRLLL